MIQIFISYSHHDRFMAESIRDFLQRNYSTWIDQEGIPGGVLWEQEITKAVSNSHAMVVLVTSSSIESNWVAREITLAREKKLQIFPLVMQQFKNIEKALQKLCIADLQGIDFAHQNNASAYQQLKNALEQFTLIWTKVNPLIEDLRSAPHFIYRVQAAETLGELHEARAIDSLVSALFSDQDSRVQATAAVALGKIGDERVVPKLIEAVERNCATESTIKALGEIGSSTAVPKLIGWLSSNNDEVVCEAIEALGKIGDKRAVQPLVDLLERFLQNNLHFHADVPKALFQALRRLANEKATSVFVSALRSKQPRIRHFAVLSLGSLKNFDAVELLIQVLLNDDDMDVKGGAIGTLGDIGDGRAIEPVLKFLDDEYLVLVSIETLGKIGDKRAVKALRACYGKHRDLRVQPALDKALHQILN